MHHQRQLTPNPKLQRHFPVVHKSYKGATVGLGSKEKLVAAGACGNHQHGSVGRNRTQVFGYHLYFVQRGAGFHIEVSGDGVGSKLLVLQHHLFVYLNGNGVAVNFAIVVKVEAHLAGIYSYFGNVFKSRFGNAVEYNGTGLAGRLAAHDLAIPNAGEGFVITVAAVHQCVVFDTNNTVGRDLKRGDDILKHRDLFIGRSIGAGKTFLYIIVDVKVVVRTARYLSVANRNLEFYMVGRKTAARHCEGAFPETTQVLGLRRHDARQE